METAGVGGIESNWPLKTNSVVNDLTWNAEKILGGVAIGAVQHNYSCDAGHARVLRV